MQRTSVCGLKEVSQGVFHLAQYITEQTDNPEHSTNFFLSHSLFLVSAEFGWFIREESTVDIYTA